MLLPNDKFGSSYDSKGSQYFSFSTMISASIFIK